MLPGPMLIKQCAACAQPFVETINSGNPFGTKFWTDGRMEAPMFPDLHWLIKCPHCQALLWIDQQQTLGDMHWGEFNGPKNVRSYIRPAVEDYLAALEPDSLDLKSDSLKPEKERYLRLWAWWSGNNPRRKSASPQPLFEWEAENLWGLAALLDEADDNDRLMKAEILRELGKFAESRALLNKPFSPHYAQSIAIIKDYVERGDSLVKEMRFQ
jgi:hypothetical protein